MKDVPCGTYTADPPLGVAPLPILVVTSTRGRKRQPKGISPRSLATNSPGNNAATSADMPNGWRAAALATTGSKSTNQDRKMARAMDSSVWFIRRLSSILSFNAQIRRATSTCSANGGKANSKASILAGAVWRIFVPDEVAKRCRLNSSQRKSQYRNPGSTRDLSCTTTRPSRWLCRYRLPSAGMRPGTPRISPPWVWQVITITISPAPSSYSFGNSPLYPFKVVESNRKPPVYEKFPILITIGVPVGGSEKYLRLKGPPCLILAREPSVTSRHPSHISQPPQPIPNGPSQLLPVAKLSFQLRHEPRHLLLKRLLILVALSRPHIPPRRQRVAVRPHLLHIRHAAEARHRLRYPRPPKRPVHRRHPLHFLARQFLLLARSGNQHPQLAPIQKQNLALAPTEAARPAAVLRQEP